LQRILICLLGFFYFFNFPESVTKVKAKKGVTSAIDDKSSIIIDIFSPTKAFFCRFNKSKPMDEFFTGLLNKSSRSFAIDLGSFKKLQSCSLEIQENPIQADNHNWKFFAIDEAGQYIQLRTKTRSDAKQTIEIMVDSQKMIRYLIFIFSPGSHKHLANLNIIAQSSFVK